MKTVTEVRYRVFAVKYFGATNSRGSKVQIKDCLLLSENFETDLK